MNEFIYRVNQKTGPTPIIRKMGALMRGVEHTPIVWKGQLWLVHSEGEHRRDGTQCICLTNVKTGEETPAFAEGYYFASAYTEGDTVYVFASSKHDNKALTMYQSDDDSGWHDPRGGHTIRMYKSTDLQTWTWKDIIHVPEKRFWNTSVCRNGDTYTMAIEVSCEEGFEIPEVGRAFTCFFAQSNDLEAWEMLPDCYSYTSERYNACPVLRYADGYYYMICLEALPCLRYAPYIYRSKDLLDWEVGIHNPIMMYNDEDRRVYSGYTMSDEDIDLLETMLNINNSDIDFCEFEGKTYIFYANGDQMGHAFICAAEFDGSEEEFLRSFFQ